MNLQEHFGNVLRLKSDMHGHLAKLNRFVYELNAQRIVELGVRKGFSTVALLAALEHTGGRLWSIDIDPPHHSLRWAYGLDHWTFIRADDRDAELAREELPDHIDMLFIDTSHGYHHTCWELKQYGPLVRSGGYIVGHDWELPGVSVPFTDWMMQTGSKLEAWPGDHGLVRLVVR